MVSARLARLVSLAERLCTTWGLTSTISVAAAACFRYRDLLPNIPQDFPRQSHFPRVLLRVIPDP